MGSDGGERVGARIRRERRRAGLSVAKLAEETGVSKTYLLRLENTGDANPSLDILRRLGEALDLTVADLVGEVPARSAGGDGEPPSLIRFADEYGVSRAEREMLASIRWRRGDEPVSSERWRFVLDSLRASRELDRE